MDMLQQIIPDNPKLDQIGKLNEYIIDLDKQRDFLKIESLKNIKKENINTNLIQQIQAGDYTLHVSKYLHIFSFKYFCLLILFEKVFIEKTKQLSIPLEEKYEIMASIQIPQFKLREFTQSKQDISQKSEVNWNEHIFLEIQGASQKKLQDSMIQISFSQKCESIGDKQIIGQYEFSLESIYQQKDHLLSHQWVALTNQLPQNYGDIMGYLKANIQIIGKGEQFIQITEEKDIDTQEYHSVFIPSNVKPKYTQLTFRLYSAQNIQDLGSIKDNIIFNKKNDINAFIMFDVDGKRVKSKVITIQNNTNKIDWNQEFSVPVRVPVMVDQILLQVWDKGETKNSDIFMGSIPLKLSKLLDDSKYQTPQWYNIYGAPLFNKKPETLHMNLNPQIASKWNGQILMDIEAKSTNDPVINATDISKLKIELANQFYKKTQFEICVDIGIGLCLPSNKQYQLRIQIQDKQFQTKQGIASKSKTNKWAERISQKFEISSREIEEIGYFYMYLIDEDKAICYKKLKASLFSKENPEWRFEQLVVDPCIDSKIENKNDAGIIQFRCFIRNCQQSNVDIQKSLGPRLSRYSSIFKMRAYIYQCQDLPSADDNGLSDPFISFQDVNDDGRKLRTKTMHNTLNPIFYEVKEFNVEAYLDKNQIPSFEAPSNDKEKQEQETIYKNFLKCSPPIVLDIYDEDDIILYKESDFLCRATIMLKKASCRFIDRTKKKVLYEFNNKNSQPNLFASVGQNQSIQQKSDFEPCTPQWHSCYYDQNSPQQGKILVSFDISAYDTEFMPKKIQLTDYIRQSLVIINIQTLGLRNLQTVGILPVKKATISFKFSSLVLSNTQNNSIKDVTTSRGPTGPNPTINRIIEYQLLLPIDRDFCPVLQCQVNDNIFAGMQQPIIGNFIIDVASILHNQNAFNEKIITDFKQLLNNIKEFNENLFPPDYCQEYSEEEIKSRVTDIENQSSSTQNFKKKSYLKSKKISQEDQEPLLKSQQEQEQQQIQNIKSSFTKDLGEFNEQDYTEAEVSLLYKYQDQLILSLQYQYNNKKEIFLIQEQLLYNESLFDITQKIDELFKSKKEQFQQQQLYKLNLQRQLIHAEFKQKVGQKAQQNIIYPEYKLDERLQCMVEFNIPPLQIFIPLGYDQTHESHVKHYRKFYDNELENEKEIMTFKPFELYQLKKENQRDKKSYFSFFTSKEQQENKDKKDKTMGQFKGIIDVYIKQKKQEQNEEKQGLINQIFELLNKINDNKDNKSTGKNFSQKQLEKIQSRRELREQLDIIGISHLNIIDLLLKGDNENFIKKQLMLKQKYQINLYVIDGYNLASRDIYGQSDPYIYATIGDQIFKDSKNYILNDSEPNFYKLIRFNSTFPGCQLLELSIYDYDEIFGDDLIGTTHIDLEDRFFSYEWQSHSQKPIETRDLFHKAYKMSQGEVRLWVDINAEIEHGTADQYKEWDIQPEPEQELEVRICVYNTKDIKMMDIEGTSDVYVAAKLNEVSQTTEIHYRCTTGVANLNYRLIIPYINKNKKIDNDKILSIKCYDKDLIGRDELIGQREIDLTDPINDCLLSKKQAFITKTYYKNYLIQNEKWNDLNLKFQDENTFFIDLFGEDGNMNGSVRIQIQIFTKEQSLIFPAGKGRNEPNQNPYLEPPEGRFQLSLDPVKLFSQLIGPEVLQTIKKDFYIFICILICIYMAPNIISNLFSAIISRLIIR